jgi:rod shape-determining protein MreC
MIKKVNDKEIIVYTSGYGGLFKSGLPVGKIIIQKIRKKNELIFFQILDN